MGLSDMGRKLRRQFIRVMLKVIPAGKTWMIDPQMEKDDPNTVVWTCLNYLPSLTCKNDAGPVNDKH